MFIIRGSDRSIGRNSNSANLHGSEISGDELRAIRQQQHDPLAGLDSKPKQAVTDAVHFLRNLTVGPGVSLKYDRCFAAAPFPDMAIDKVVGQIIKRRQIY